MKETEKGTRAWILKAMRDARRLPSWFDDDAISRAMAIEEISPPDRLTKSQRSLIQRIRGQCSSCRRPSLLGCTRCWFDQPIVSPDLETRIAILRASRQQGIAPKWLTDLAIARAFSVAPSRVGRSEFTGILCANCGNAGNTACLACHVQRS